MDWNAGLKQFIYIKYYLTDVCYSILRVNNFREEGVDMRLRNSIFFIGLMSLLFTGCTSKPPEQEVVSESKEAIKKHQDNVKRLDYYRSVAMISEVTLSELDELIDGEPTAAGELVVLSAEETAQAISEELLKSFSDSIEGSLPIVAHWNTGYPKYTNGMNPDYMLSLVENGLHVIPSWHLDPYWNDSVPQTYYEESILKAAELKLPLIFITKPFEAALLQDSYYSNIVGLNNPKVLDEDGKYYDELSPFASDRNWYSVGKRWARSAILQKIQKWYPDPPLVMFVADEKVLKLNWINAETSQRYVDTYSKNANYQDENFRRNALGDAWKNKYKQLKRGFQRSLQSSIWKNNIKFVSYNELPVDMGEESSWKNDATYTNERLSIWKETSDATVSEYHLKTDGSESASSIKGPHTRANNLPFIFKETQGVNPDFTGQLSLSDGHQFDSPESYRGFTQMALWLTRPSVIRESASWSSDRDDIGLHFQEIIDSVEMIHNNTMLHRFWREGKLLANDNYSNPNNSAIPTQYQDAQRWFMLDVDANPQQPWDSSDQIAVWAIALEVGKAPEREWLLYAQSPSGDQHDIAVTIPGYESVIVDSNTEGAFYVINELQEEGSVVAQVAGAGQITEPAVPDSEPTVSETETNGRYATYSVIDGKVYGAKADARGSIGGGSGYTKIITTGDYIVHNYAQLVEALAKASSGDIVFIPSDSVIVFDGEYGVDVPKGVTVASDRGYNNSLGALLKRDKNVKNSEIFYIETSNTDVRLTGLRIEGAHKDRTWMNEASHKGIRTWGDRLEVDNCEISGFGVAAIDVGNATNGVSIHHNNIHHNQMDGLGYGVLINRSDAVVEYNIFDRNRHDVSGSGTEGSFYIARHNVSGNATNAHYDMHGYELSDTDGNGGIAGASVTIHNNYMPNPTEQIYLINIRGVPTDGPADIYNNIFESHIDDNPCVATSFTPREKTVDVRTNLYVNERELK